MYRPQLFLLGEANEEFDYAGKLLSRQFEVRKIHADECLNARWRAAGVIILVLGAKGGAQLLEILPLLRKQNPRSPILVLSWRNDPEAIRAAFCKQADNVILLPKEQDQVLDLIEEQAQARPLTFLQRWTARFRQWAQLKETLRVYRPHRWQNPEGIVLPGVIPANPNKCESPDISVRFFGHLELDFHGRRLPSIPGRKAASLLAFLLFRHHKPVHRDILMEKFWGDNTPSSARNSLNVAIHTLRKHFARACPEREFILFHNESYTINPELEIITDTGQFLGYWCKGRSSEAAQGLTAAIGDYKKAAALYRGDLLEELLYEEWCETERENLKETYLLILDRIGAYFLETGALPAAINVCKKILGKDPCLEDAHRRLIRCYDLLGYRDLAIRQYYKCADVLKGEWEVEPSVATKELFGRISGE